MNQKFVNPRLEIVRDIFIFACLTGMSYIDIKNLTADRITTSIDGSKWIVQKREKTNTPYRVKLLDIPLQLIEKYKSNRKGDRIFPAPANSSCNLRLKEIAKQCGINKYICFHLSRHSFATLALTKGMSLESVSKILGHTKITTTQIYAKITTEKIGRDMDLLSEKLEKLRVV